MKNYQSERDTLGKKDPKTGKREDSGLKMWLKWKPKLAIVPESFDAKLLKDFAVWRKKEAKQQERVLSGRTVDLNITALANVVRWCVVEKWLAEFPTGWKWETLGEEPDECELLTDAQLQRLCASAMSVPEMGLLERGGAPKASLRQYITEGGAAELQRLLETTISHWSAGTGDAQAAVAQCGLEPAEVSLPGRS